MQLRFEPVDMFFFVDYDMLQKFPSAIVGSFNAGFDPGAKHREGGKFETEVVFELLLHTGPNRDPVVSR